MWAGVGERALNGEEICIASGRWQLAQPHLPTGWERHSTRHAVVHVVLCHWRGTGQNTAWCTFTTCEIAARRHANSSVRAHTPGKFSLARQLARRIRHPARHSELFPADQFDLHLPPVPCPAHTHTHTCGAGTGENLVTTVLDLVETRRGTKHARHAGRAWHSEPGALAAFVIHLSLRHCLPLLSFPRICTLPTRTSLPGPVASLHQRSTRRKRLNTQFRAGKGQKTQTLRAVRERRRARRARARGEPQRQAGQACRFSAS